MKNHSYEVNIMYFRIKKISNEELEERRSLTAINFAVSMEKGELPWQKSFNPENGEVGQLPYDVISKKHITGYNMVELTVHKPEEKQFITFNDVQKKNYRVKKGSKSTPIEDIRKYDISYPIDPKTKKWTFTMTPSKDYIAYNKAVFSVNDLTNKYNFEEPVSNIDGIKFTKKLLQETGVKVVEEKGLASAYYAPRRDEIHIGEKEQYKNEKEYYADLLRQGVRSLTKPGRAFQEGTKGFGKDRSDIEFLKDKFRLDLAVYQLSCMLKFPYKPSMNNLNNKQLLYNFGKYPYYLVKAARDSDVIMRKAINLCLDRQQSKETDKTKAEVQSPKEAPQTKTEPSKNIDMSTAKIVDKEEFVDKLKAAMRKKQEAKKETIIEPKESLKSYIFSSIKDGKLSDRAIVDTALKQHFKEFQGKTTIEKRKLVYSLKKEAYSQNRALAR